MELFELLGKIVINGADDAKYNMDSVADNAEKNAEKIRNAFEKIGAGFHFNNSFSADADVGNTPSADYNNINYTEYSFTQTPVIKNLDIPKYSFTETPVIKNLDIPKYSFTENPVVKNLDIPKYSFTENPVVKNLDVPKYSFTETPVIKNLDIPKYSFTQTPVIKNFDIPEYSFDENFFPQDFTSAKFSWDKFSLISDALKNISTEFQKQSSHIEIAQNAASDYHNTLSRLNTENLKIAVNEGDAEKVNSFIKNLSDNFIKAENSNAISLKRQTDNLSSALTFMKNASAKGMSAVTHTQINQLNQLYLKSRNEWNKISSSASFAVSNMASAIISKSPLVENACKSLSDNASDNLCLDASFAGEYIISTFENGIVSKAWSLYNTVSGIAGSISDIMSGIILSADITASAAPDTKNYSKLPGHAKGGIVTKEHIARVGEDGAEAIIPLEKNTEWIDNVAKRLNGNTSDNAVLEKLDELNSNIKNLGIYLDGKTLVGSIAPQIDSALGSIARLKKRGAR